MVSIKVGGGNMDKKLRKKLITVLSMITTTLLMGAVSACSPASSARKAEPVGPKFVAHRGYSHAYPANTESAFVAAAGMSFYGIETDIRKTKDDYFVCNHDATVLYADGTQKEISSTKLSALLANPIYNDKTDSEVYLCTFETYLQACKQGGKVAVIELKDYFNSTSVAKILNIIDNEYDRKKVCFISFSYGALQQVKKADASIELQYLSQTENDPTFDLCLSNGISIDVRSTILTEELVKTFHDAGLKVNVWTVNQPYELETAYECGVDYITSDLFHGE